MNKDGFRWWVVLAIVAAYFGGSQLATGLLQPGWGLVAVQAVWFLGMMGFSWQAAERRWFMGGDDNDDSEH